MATTTDVVSVERVIPAPAAAIFAVISNPARHHEIDGSGTVREAKDVSDEQLGLGSTFGMSMKMGIPYSMVSTVIEFEPDRRFAFQTRPPAPFTKLGGGRIWRYELEPVEGGTLVRESWDISEERVKFVVRPAANKTRENMTKTLERLESVVTA